MIERNEVNEEVDVRKREREIIVSEKRKRKGYNIRR